MFLTEERPYLDLQGHQSHHRRAEGQRRRQVGAQVEQRKAVGHTGGADHAHHLMTHTLKVMPIPQENHLPCALYVLSVPG